MVNTLVLSLGQKHRICMDVNGSKTIVAELAINAQHAEYVLDALDKVYRQNYYIERVQQ